MRSWERWLRRRWALGRLWWHEPLGRRGEKLAACYLRRQGCQIVARGLRVRHDELDLIAVQERTIIFVEVKTRRALRPNESLGESITQDKERRITRAAYAFLKRHRLLDFPVRFDVITVLWPHNGRPELRHYPHAFEAAGDESSLY